MQESAVVKSIQDITDHYAFLFTFSIPDSKFYSRKKIFSNHTALTLNSWIIMFYKNIDNWWIFVVQYVTTTHPLCDRQLCHLLEGVPVEEV